MPAAANGVVSRALETHEKLHIDQVIARFIDKPGALLGILEAVQSANAHKYLSMESLRYIAEQTGVPPARIFSAATFYALFNLDPQGDNVVCVCRGTACHTRGSRDLLGETVPRSRPQRPQRGRIERGRQAGSDDTGSEIHRPHGGLLRSMRIGTGGGSESPHP